MVLFTVMRAKRRFDVRKKGDQVARIGGRGGWGGVYLIWAMPERKRAFPYEVFPKNGTKQVKRELKAHNFHQKKILPAYEQQMS